MADRTAAQVTNLVEYTVSELAFALKRTVEDAYGLIKLRGEISGYRGPHSSGHCYFTLKDENACIEAVIWRSTFARLKFKPEAGLEVAVRQHDKTVAAIEQDLAAVQRRADAEQKRWEKLKERLETDLRNAGR